ncbi:MAG: mltD 2 [Gammaproteobacteria bacterium]|jgi:membrane-bound lytic murein transglycosylase D|nr:mltD 2 [Gammaproteobacteria bacterium]
MKKHLSLLLIIFYGLMTGCTNFQGLNTTPQASTVKQPKPIVRRNKTTTNTTSSAAISLNDFTDLNLNNHDGSAGNLWPDIASGLKLEDNENRPEVQEQIRWFMAHPGYLQRTVERARPYLYIVYQEVKSRNLPTELVLLPINESAYYPFSYSSRGATGIWQLMPGTASDWGLKRNFWYDGRRDIFDSTNAALDYLTYLAHYFNGDWLLAIAAYDTGEGNIENAIQRNIRAGLPTDFWSLRVASETRAYVPRLLALAAILAHPDRYPIALPIVDAKPVVGSVHINQQLKLTDAAKLAGISVAQLKILNPGLGRYATDPSSDAKLLLPIDSIESFKTNLSGFAPSQTTPAPQTFGRYRVQRGDTLASIARRFNIEIDDLRQANPTLGRHVTRGMVLSIPNVAENFKPSTQINLDQTPLTLKPSNEDISSSDTNDKVNQAPAQSTPAATAPKHVIKHKVQKGETLSSISKRYHVSVQQLQQLNPDLTTLHPGQVITIQITQQSLGKSHSAANQAKKIVKKVIRKKRKPHVS